MSTIISFGVDFQFITRCTNPPFYLSNHPFFIMSPSLTITLTLWMIAVGSTCLSFDVVIVDEASQATEAEVRKLFIGLCFDILPTLSLLLEAVYGLNLLLKRFRSSTGQCTVTSHFLSFDTQCLTTHCSTQLFSPPHILCDSFIPFYTV